MAAKILVVNVNWLGDAVFSIPVFSALKRHYPGSRVACLAVRRVRPVLEQAAGIDEIIDCPESFSVPGFFRYCALAAILRGKGFDKVFFLHRSFSRRFLAILAGIPERIGYENPRRPGGLTRSIAPPDINSMHRSDYYLNVLEQSGVEVGDRTCRLSAGPEKIKAIQEILQRSGFVPGQRFAVIHPGANWNLKRWPVEFHARLAGRLVEELDLPVILSGGPGDTGIHRQIQSRAQAGGAELKSLAGQLSLPDFIALLKTATVVVSADSGPLHIANSLGTPVVALYGPTRPEITGPRGEGRVVVLQRDVGCNRQACYFLDCPDNICMKAVTVTEVMNAVKQVILQ